MCLPVCCFQLLFAGMLSTYCSEAAASLAETMALKESVQNLKVTFTGFFSWSLQADQIGEHRVAAVAGRRERQESLRGACAAEALAEIPLCGCSAIESARPRSCHQDWPSCRAWGCKAREGVEIPETHKGKNLLCFLSEEELFNFFPWDLIYKNFLTQGEWSSSVFVTEFHYVHLCKWILKALRRVLQKQRMKKCAKKILSCSEN